MAALVKGTEMKEKHIERLKTEPVYAILGSEVSRGRSNEDVTRALIAGGIKIIQYREKNKTAREKYEECLRLRELTKEADVTFIINDSADLAMACGADGIHVGQKDMPAAAVRRLVGDEMLIGVSTNTAEDMKLAAAEHIADYIGLGPMYATATKKDANPIAGEEARRLAVSGYPLPVVAIGGITKERTPELQAQGFSSFAMISALVSAPDIAAAAKEIRRQLLKD